MTASIRSDASGTYGALQFNGADVVKFDTTGVSQGAGRRVAQIVEYKTGTVATGTTIIPPDNTIPQITEGDQYLTASITPTSSSSTLEVSVMLNCGCSVLNNVVLALFKDAGVSAVAGLNNYVSTTNTMTLFNLTYTVASGSVSPTTFSVRVGGGVASTITLNGALGTQRLGGVLFSSITIKEYLP